jgi:hypothetical protein
VFDHVMLDGHTYESRLTTQIDLLGPQKRMGSVVSAEITHGCENDGREAKALSTILLITRVLSPARVFNSARIAEEL